MLVGLLPLEQGAIYWNGELVEQRATFFVPPRAAYTGQTPRLFSDTLRSNILLGMPAAATELALAIHTAVMEKDLQDLENGLETTVGPRGVKLSGGQVQRTAAARMLARQPELYVFDDLSSALDVETERTLWERLFAQPADSDHTPTCLVVSHRRAALRRADHILVLKDGQLEDEGTLAELLERCEEMQRLWAGDSQPQ
jgi:ATP-binding cassette subfamily B protein